jgi:hypothetical protein
MDIRPLSLVLLGMSTKLGDLARYIGEALVGLGFALPLLVARILGGCRLSLFHERLIVRSNYNSTMCLITILKVR